MSKSKPFREMTSDELRDEWAHWNKEVRDYPCWGAGLVVADNYRKACVAELERRGVPIPEN